MNFLFWNIRKNKNVFPILKDIFRTYDVDICLLAECPEDYQENADKVIGDRYKFHKGIASGKITYIHKKNIIVESIKDTDRASSKSVYVSQNRINVIGCHLKDKCNYTEVAQRSFASFFCEFINETEKQEHNYKTIVIGDFNMNPFEEAMTSVLYLNSVMDKNTAKKVTRTYIGKQYRYFYNPMWKVWGHFQNMPGGTIYYYKSHDPMLLYWNMFDQILIRPELLNSFCDSSLKIISYTENYNLLQKSGRINNNISDHLPIFFTLKLE